MAKTADLNISLKDKALPLMMEYGIYAFAFLMFAGRLGTVREIGLYAPPSIWLINCTLEKRFDIELKSPLFVLLVLLSISALISTIGSTNLLDALHLVKGEYLKMILLFIAIPAAFPTNERLGRFARFLSLSGIAYLFFGAYRISGDLIKTGVIQYMKTRDYATIIMFFLPFIIFRSIESRGFKRALWIALVLAGIAEIIVIGVRGSWIALFVVLCVWAYFIMRAYAKQLFSAIKVLSTLLLAITSVAVIFFIAFPAQYNFIKKHTSQKIQLSLRFETWKGFLAMSKDSLLLGRGIDDNAMKERYKKFYESTHGNPPEDIPITPHNQFIKILYQQGILGLGLYALLLTILVFVIWKRFPALMLKNNGAMLGIAITTSVIGEYIIRCMSEDRSLIPLGVLIGMAGAFLKSEPGRDRD